MTKKIINVLEYEIREIDKVIDLKFVEIRQMQDTILRKRDKIKFLEDTGKRWCKLCSRESTDNQSGICELCINARVELKKQ